MGKFCVVLMKSGIRKIPYLSVFHTNLILTITFLLIRATPIINMFNL